MKHEQRYLWFDLVRGLAALEVCAGHLRGVYLVDFGQISSPNLGHKALYFLTGFGHEAVIVFFVLSGYFVGGSVLRNAARFSWADYLIARITRLWIVLLPTLVMTAVVGLVLRAAAPELLEGAYHAAWSMGPSTATPYSDSVLTFVGNLFFLQTILVPIFGVNYPMWSLANEFWYYLLFPLAMSAVLAWRSGAPRGLAVGLAYAAAFAAIVGLLMPGKMLEGFGIWMLGVVVVALGERARPLTPWLLVLGAALFGGSLVYAKSAGLQSSIGIGADIVVGISFFTLCLALVNLPWPKRLPAIAGYLARGLSEVSYSLYLVHFPLLMLVGGLVLQGRQEAPTASVVAIYLLGLGVMVAVSIGFWWLFESRTVVVKRLVTRIVTGRQPEPRAATAGAKAPAADA